MRYTIRGLTEQTITINSLKLTIRGNHKDLVKFPHSVAKSIDVISEEQLSDLRGLSRIGLISIESEEQQAEVLRQEKEKLPKVSQKVKPIKLMSNRKTKASSLKKFSKANPVDKTADKIQQPPAVSPVESDEATMVSGEGKIIKGKMMKSKSVSWEDEPEITRASMEAARLMAEEEAMPEYVVDESKLDESEKMGTNAVIATGSKMASAKVKMKKSAIPESSLTAKINWIDSSKKDGLDVNNAFIDKPSDPDEKSDSFIE